MMRTLLILGLLAGTAWAQPTAMILRLDGHAQITIEDHTSPARSLVKLPAGSTVKIQDGRVTFFYFGDRHQEVATGPTVIRVGATGGEGASLQKQPASGSVSAMPAGNVGRMGGLTVRGPAKPRLMMAGPAGTRPTLSWVLPAPTPPTPYKLALSADGKELWAKEVKGTSATYDGPPLTAGATYQWELTAGSEPVQRSFVVLSDESRKSLAALRQQASEAPQGDAEPFLLLMTLYDNYGSLEDALSAGLEAARRRPNDGGIQLALADLYEQTGQIAEMVKAQDKAKALGVTPDY